jgi:hypothetical protein
LEIITGNLFISRRLKKQIGENIVNVPCALNVKMAALLEVDVADQKEQRLYTWITLRGND